MNKATLTKYADLIIRSGVNLKKGQTLVIRSDINAYPLVRAVCKKAYKRGAAKVIVKWSDEKLAQLDYTYQNVCTLGNVEQYIIDERNEWADKKFPFVAIVSDDPDALESCDSNKVSARIKAMSAATKRWRNAELANEFNWTIAAYPSKEWAAKVFPKEKISVAVKKLEDCIIKASRLDCCDAVGAWKEHSARLRKLCDKLNAANISSLHYKSANGTDITVGLPDNYVFLGGSEQGLSGVPFNANIPSEEIFTAPHRLHVDGIVYSTLPLARQGKIIDKFWLKFESGRVVDFAAEQGCDVLKNIIETDGGSHYLGEVALVPYDSPIQNMGVLFYETLFDENASCHFALGGAYASSVAGGEGMSEEQRFAAGLNESNEHVDFMVGSRDLEITAITKDGGTFKVMSGGNFAF